MKASTYLNRDKCAGSNGLWYILSCVALLVSWQIANAEQSIVKNFPYEGAVGYCRGNVPRPIVLSSDKSIACFDGGITRALDISSVEGLQENGLFVVRSSGGDIAKAIALANLLHDKHAIVVVHDFCISACASYLLIASEQAFVRRESIVVWHLRRSGLADCIHVNPSNDGPKSFDRGPCPDVPPENQTYYREVEALSTRFYRERTIASGFDPPESIHVRRVLKNMMDATGVYPDVGWTWNPRYYKSVLKTKISYEVYPENQDEVDKIVTRFHFPRVIYDP
jgi:hypothetical protein